MIENFQKMRNYFITKIRNFDSFSFPDVSYSFVPRVMRDGVDTLGRARPVCTEALIFIWRIVLQYRLRMDKYIFVAKFIFLSRTEDAKQSKNFSWNETELR